jgi:hypothetical protein
MRRIVLHLAIAAALAASAARAQSWQEDGDAPNLPPGQSTVGDGVLTAINGALSNGNDVDLYAILVDNPATFAAKTCGGTSIDSTLYLFDENGNGISMSEDNCGAQSWITNQFVTTTGLYYLAMTAYDYDPQDGLSQDIWNDSPFGEERAPDGPGAAGTLTGWAGGGGGGGAYHIELTGAQFAVYGPPPSTGGCCYENGTCQVVTANSCTSLGGTYQGDDSTCEPNLCPAPATGACCFFTHGCLVITEEMCTANDGEYKGDDTMCWPNPCTSGEPPSLGWTENFDSYENGTVMYNIGGWTGWDDNPAATGTISDTQARSAPQSLMVNDTSDAIHPVAGIEGGKWKITAWQYLPSNLSGVSYFVVNTYYQHGGPYFWAVELHFDPVTGQVNDAIRDTDSLHPLPVVYDQWVEIRIEADLSSGLGTINEYYNNQLLVSGNWIAGAIGQLAIGNIDLYAPHGSPVYYDDISIVPNEGGGEEPTTPVRPLFAGVQYGDLPTRTTNLNGQPAVTWNNGFDFSVDGAAGRPDGALYITTGAFTSELYLAPLEGPAIHLCNLTEAMSGLAYGRGRLFGFSNSSLAIYEINPSTCDKAILVSTGQRRFFGLDYNAADDKLYGYDEYGSPSGLCSIDIDTGEIVRVAASVPAENSAARGLACGDNKCYALTIYGEYGMFVYDLAQGMNGTWQPLAHPFPESNSTGGAAWIAAPGPGDLNVDGHVDLSDTAKFADCLTGPSVETLPGCALADLSADEDVDLEDFAIMTVHFGQ